MSFIFLASTLLLARPARAYQPEMDYWFIERITLGKADLPNGVTIRTSDPATSPRGSLVLENKSGAPLYVMSLNYKDVLVMVTPDPEWKDRVNLAHEAAAYLVLPERPAALTIEALIDLDHSLVDYNVLSFDPPSNNLAIPTVQNSELLLVYEGQVLEVPFSVSYTINTRFDNDSVVTKTWTANVQATDHSGANQTAITNKARTRENNIILGLAIVVLLSVVGWATWRAIHRRS